MIDRTVVAAYPESMRMRSFRKLPWLIARFRTGNLSGRFSSVVLLVLFWVGPVEPSSSQNAAERPHPTDTAKDVQFFSAKIKPLLEQNCFKCHGGGARVKAGLRLTTREGLLKGGDQGPAVNLDHPELSLLLDMLSYRDEQHQMPPTGKLREEQIALLREWIEKGLPWSKDTTEEKPIENPAPAKSDPKKHWAFQPLKRPDVPNVHEVHDVDGPEPRPNPIDAFILRKLEEKGLQPASQASRGVLIRRATYDLIGLPPTPEQARAFVNDPSPNAYEKLVDDLLASPHYGEKWGRHWLDVVRYAETNGYERDGDKPHIWRYRDYVIDAFNKDKPYNQFIREQLAGDELPNAGPEQIIATGYYRLNIWDDEPADKDQGRYDTLDSLVDTTAQAFLGLTIGCARCHDHKLDPLPQTDYYGFLSFFQGITEQDRGNPNKITRSLMPPEEQFEYDLQVWGRDAKVKKLDADLAAFEKEFISKWNRRDELARVFAGVPEGATPGTAPTPIEVPDLLEKHGAEIMGAEEFAFYRWTKKKADALRGQQFPGKWAACVEEIGPEPPETHVLLRGNPHVPGDLVKPAFPAILCSTKPEIPAPSKNAKTSGRRRALAEWIASDENPLTARVMVNRIWQHHFGHGIVRTSNNFGLQGDPPTHPELLDWLAAEFIRSGWSVKAMHRLIMTSKAYQMSSAGNEKGLAEDPANDLFWRHDMRRLTAEEIRDSILAVSGNLNLKTGGPSVYPKMLGAVLATSSMPAAVWSASPPEEQNRRSVYIHVKRSLLTPLLADYDFADTDSSCPVRFVSTQPLQSLNMLNSEFISEQARQFAGRLRRESPNGAESQIKTGINLVTGREAKSVEIAEGMRLIGEMRDRNHLSPDQSLERFCLLALNLNEFIYLD